MHSSSSLSNVQALPFAFHCAMHCCSIHMPFTIFRKLIFPPMPPSLLKLLAASLVHGESSTHPTRDHVPELMNAQSFPCAEIPAMAEAVSWHAGAISRVLRKACNHASPPSTQPMSVPGCTTGGAAFKSRPVAEKISGHQSRLLIPSS